MPAPYQLEIITPDRVVYSGTVLSLVAPGQEGYLGVWARHAPLLARLRSGEVKVTEADGPEIYFAISGGFLEVRSESVTLLADAAERPEEIDVTRAQAAMERAMARLNEQSHDTDVARARAGRERAMNRLRLAEKHLR